MSEKTQSLQPHDRYFAALLLIGSGALVLLFQWTQINLIGLLILPALAAAFLIWGFYTRRFGFVIPGCILLGLGIPIFVVQAFPNLSAPTTGGVFVLGLALGFATIAALSLFFKKAWWPLIPAGVLGLIGVLLAGGESGLSILRLIDILWPLVLLAIGLYILFVPILRQS